MRRSTLAASPRADLGMRREWREQVSGGAIEQTNRPAGMAVHDRGSKAMAKRPTTDEGDEPVELNIGLDKIQDIVLRARAFDLEDFPDEPDPGDAAEAAHDREEQLDEGEDPSEAELRELIDDLNDDEVVDLIALVWIGRGDFTRDELTQARELARERHQGSSSKYLMGIPTLAEYLAEGLAEAGHDLEGLEPD